MEGHHATLQNDRQYGCEMSILPEGLGPITLAAMKGGSAPPLVQAAQAAMAGRAGGAVSAQPGNAESLSNQRPVFL